MKVEKVNYPHAIFEQNDGKRNRTLLWERKETEAITLNTSEVFDILRKKYGHDATISIDGAYVTLTDIPVSLSTDEYYIKEKLK